MSARLLLAAGCAALLAGGCGKPDAAAPAGNSVAASAVVRPPPAPSAPAHDVLRGQALLGKDGYGIVPCGESAQRILEVAPAAQPFLDKFLASGAREFFLEGLGEDAGEGRVRASHIDRLYTEGPGCEARLEGFAFAAYGNEPFWALIDGREGLRLERPGEATLLAPGSGLQEQSGEWFAEADTASGKLSLRLAPGYCSDGMSDALYAWTATARLGEQVFHGCAFRGLGKARP